MLANTPSSYFQMLSAVIVAFDIIGTCFSLNKPRQKLISMGAPAYALDLWFAQALRDSFAFSHAGGYKPLKEILATELPRTLKLLKVAVNSTQISQVMATFSELDLQPGAIEAFQMLTEEGFYLVALTNGSKNSTHQLLERAGVQKYFTQVFSCDAIARTKPHKDAYAMIQKDSKGEIWLVAAHAWDIAGAARAGLKTVFVTQLEEDYLNIYPQPQVTVNNLVEAASQILLAKH